MRTTLRRLLPTLVLVMLTVTGLSAPTASAADDTRLTAVSISGDTVTSTTTATLNFSLTGTLPRAIEAVLVNEESGAIVRPRQDVKAPTGTLPIAWSSRWPGGTYRLDRVHVIARGTTSPSGPVTTYWADGRVTVDAVESGNHGLGFAQAAIMVQGQQTGELAPPTLSAVAWKARPVHEGDSLAIDVMANDEVSPIAEVRALWRNASGEFLVNQVQSVARGRITLSVPAQAGRYELMFIIVTDQSMLATTYRRDGMITHGTSTPEQSLALRGWTRPEPHPFTFSDFDISVTPPSPYLNTSLIRGGPGRAEIAWGHDNAASVTAWRLVATPGGRTLRLPAATEGRDGAGWRTATLTGLTNGTTYSVSVVAESLYGDSKAATVSVTPQMSTSIVGLPKYQWDFSLIVGAEASRFRSGYVKRYPVVAGGFRAPSTDALNMNRIASGGNLLRLGVPTLLGVVEDNLVVAHGYENKVIGTGWRSMRWIDGGADFTGDGHTDVIAVNAAGQFLIYPSIAAGKLGSPRTVGTGTGWSAFLAVFTPGDFNGDRKADVLAVDKTGALWLYKGNGSGTWLSRTQVGSGWQNFAGVNAARDFDGDGREDVLAATQEGKLLLYPGNGVGGTRAPRTIGAGWQMFF